MISVRPYQTRGLDLGREAYRHHRRVLLVAPTGAGKTILFSLVARGALARGRRVLVLVHRRELIGQTARKMADAGIERVGIVAAGIEPDPGARVQIASIQTMIAREALPPAELVILDEAHHYVAATWGEVAAHYATAKILGVTATPERGDGTPLGDLFDVLIPIVTPMQLIADGYLVQPRVIAPARYTRMSDLSPEAVLSAIHEHAADRTRIVVFGRTIEHAQDIAAHVRAAGIEARTVSAETPTDERDATLQAFAEGAIRVVSNVFCLTEGWDCPAADCAVLARGFSHAGSYIQAVGRVLRPAPGKRDALVIDLRGVVHRHGLPEADREYSLDGRAISGAAPTRTCPECETEIPLAAPSCPHCGHEFPAPADPTVNGERVKLSRVDRASLERSTWAELVETARMRGYRPGWVVHRWSERFGRFPSALWRETFPRRVA